MGEGEALEEFGGFCFASSAVEREGFEDGEQVLFAGESLEDGWFLGEVSHTELCVSVHWEAGDFGVVEDDASGVSSTTVRLLNDLRSLIASRRAMGEV